jgi:large subunit ribosomal protein L4e
MVMKAQVIGIDGSQKGEISVSNAFSEKVRPDLVARAFLAEMSSARQPYGTDPSAGFRTSAHYHGLRHYKYSMMNREMARMPRIHGRVGYMSHTARRVPQATKGREAHPPKVEKVWEEKINSKEWLKAMNSAIAATAHKDIVASRGHAIDSVKSFPMIVEDSIQEIRKAKALRKALETLGLEKEMERTAVTRERAGKGKMRGRKSRERRGLLIVVADDRGIVKAARGIAGVEAVKLGDLCMLEIAPGAKPGRATIWSRSAVEALEKAK